MLVKRALFSMVALVKLAQVKLALLNLVQVKLAACQVSLFQVSTSQVCPFQVGFWFYRILLTITIRYSHDSLPPYNLVTIASYLTSSIHQHQTSDSNN